MVEQEKPLNEDELEGLVRDCVEAALEIHPEDISRSCKSYRGYITRVPANQRRQFVRMYIEASRKSSEQSFP